jgi:RNA polymerase sigma-70 factor (ECF subfamily)
MPGRCAAAPEKFELLLRLGHPVCEMPGTVSDAELVHAARAGDAGALGGLLERHRAPLYASALSILGERAEAQDAVQDAYLVALQRLDDLRDPAAAAGWLHAIVRNASLMRLRRPVRELAIDPPEDPRAASDAEEAIERLAVSDWVWTALERLPQDQRVTIMLRYFGRHASYEEIAATLGVPVGTIRSRLNQAKARLADDLLRTASTAHLDHDKLIAERKHEWDAIVHEAYTTGTASLYVTDCAPDVLVEAPSMAYRELGAEDQRRGVEDTVAAGVRLELTEIVASNSVTIWEGDYHNPTHDPHHCPPSHTEVRLHPAGQTTRLVLYFPPRASPA